MTCGAGITLCTRGSRRVASFCGDFRTCCGCCCAIASAAATPSAPAASTAAPLTGSRTCLFPGRSSFGSGCLCRCPGTIHSDGSSFLRTGCASFALLLRLARAFLPSLLSRITLPTVTASARTLPALAVP